MPFFEKFTLNEKEKPKLERTPTDKKVDLGRRRFIKNAALASLGLAAGTYPLLKVGKKSGEGIRDIWEEIKEAVEPGDPDRQATEQQKEIEEQDKKTIGKTIEQQIEENNKVELNRKTKNAVFQKWYESYSPPEGKNYPGLLKALEKMSPWIDKMKEIFKAERVPKDFVYLSIPESHFDLKAFSRKKAAGPFQFIVKTAKGYDLLVTDNYDERYDPIKSARACARYLKENYGKFNQDWNLALADYNGSFTRRYAECRPNKGDRNYDDYLTWREKRLNNFIAERLKTNKSIKEIIDELDDSLENLNYPEKFFAVLSVIKKE